MHESPSDRPDASSDVVAVLRRLGRDPGFLASVRGSPHTALRDYRLHDDDLRVIAVVVDVSPDDTTTSASRRATPAAEQNQPPSAAPS